MKAHGFKWMLATASVTALVGCSNIITSSRIERDVSKGSNGSDSAGVMIYALPRALLRIESGPEDSSPEGNDAVGGDGSGTKGVEAPAKDATNKSKKSPGQGLPNRPATLEYAVSAEIVADTAASFQVNYETSWFSADAVKLATEHGLLKSVSAASDDRTHEAVVKLARSVGAAQGFTLPIGTDSSGGGTVSTADTSKTKNWESQFCAPTDRFVVYLDLKSDNLPGWVSLKFMDGSGEAVSREAQFRDKSKPSEADIEKICAQGVCTRSLRPLRVRVNEQCMSAGGFRDTIVYVPDEREFTSVKLDRTMFADNCFGVKFDKGIISEVTLRNASSAENLASIPEDVLRALVSIPSELLQLRFNYNVAQRDLTASEMSRIQAEKALQDYVSGRATTPQDLPGVKPSGKESQLSGGDNSPAPAAGPTLNDAQCSVDSNPRA